MTGPRSKRPHWTRRQVLETGLQGGAATLAAMYGLRPDFALAADVPAEFDGTKFQLKAPEPNPKRGGVLRYGITSRPPHFDVHQSGTINSLGCQGCMFDNLIRRDPRDSGKTIIPDLAHSWQISKDGKTYTFLLRKDVQFHDGAEFTADDVKATYDRIAKPPAGISIPRSILFSSVSEINVRDKHTIEFKLSEPRPSNFIMSGFASGWNVIFRKKTLEDNNYNLRRVVDIPGTGPFKSKRRVENEVWAMERNPNYWNKEVPYLDGLEFYHGLPFSSELGSAVLAGRTDYARIVDPITARKAKETPGMSSLNYYQSVIQGTWPNAKKKPFDDPRVRRAVHLVLERAVLVDVTKDVAPMMVGGFIYPFSEFATPLDELVKRPGYQADSTAAIKEAKALMAAAGYKGGAPLDFLVRDVATFKLWAQAIQAMLQQALGLECKLRTVVESVWFDDIKSGNFDMAVGAVVSTLLDPSDYFNAWYKKDGPQNYSGWDNAEFNQLMPLIDSEVDPGKRIAHIRRAEQVLEQEVPVFPICWEKINDVWYNYVKGHNPKDYFGIYDVVRMDTMWLDKA
jgi:peptide/nickel transport system substrate-binding protein